ncbi:hypothetical protein E1B28_010845 [Marasmius oreades]|uniref:Alanine racemase N-terminal domain-containing protein n=1 Tax=Marasmius oreades TaxID=181124 RepID=A0A9P7RTE0_9AGAR|nr:uncharacterized protein E1B28_010845 [Marasmius oreades]KAG7089137.1 hypothetical protein E1B28_010845 [Marasmius oreades]
MIYEYTRSAKSQNGSSQIAIPNLHTVQTLSSEKTANALNKSLPEDRSARLNVLIQINTSGEDSKSGVPPLFRGSPGDADGGELKQLAKHIVLKCPNLRLQGLMTIGALELSLTATETEKNADFERLKETRDLLSEWLVRELGDEAKGRWGAGEGRLVLSMGMSSDFEAALKAGSDIVRVGTGIFGQRKTKDEVKVSAASS